MKITLKKDISVVFDSHRYDLEAGEHEVTDHLGRHIEKMDDNEEETIVPPTGGDTMNSKKPASKRKPTTK
jgi:hypothetical protein